MEQDQSTGAGRARHLSTAHRPFRAKHRLRGDEQRRLPRHANGRRNQLRPIRRLRRVGNRRRRRLLGESAARVRRSSASLRDVRPWSLEIRWHELEPAQRRHPGCRLGHDQPGARAEQHVGALCPRGERDDRASPGRLQNHDRRRVTRGRRRCLERGARRRDAERFELRLLQQRHRGRSHQPRYRLGRRSEHLSNIGRRNDVVQRRERNRCFLPGLRAQRPSCRGFRSGKHQDRLRGHRRRTLSHDRHVGDELALEQCVAWPDGHAVLQAHIAASAGRYRRRRHAGQRHPDHIRQPDVVPAVSLRRVDGRDRRGEREHALLELQLFPVSPDEPCAWNGWRGQRPMDVPGWRQHQESDCDRPGHSGCCARGRDRRDRLPTAQNDRWPELEQRKSQSDGIELHLRRHHRDCSLISLPDLLRRHHQQRDLAHDRWRDELDTSEHRVAIHVRDLLDLRRCDKSGAGPCIHHQGSLSDDQHGGALGFDRRDGRDETAD